MIKKIWGILVLGAIVGQGAWGKHQTCLILDSTARERELYKPLIEILSVAKYHVRYAGIDEIMDLPARRLRLPHYDTVFFLLGSEFFAGLPHSHVSRKILTLLSHYAMLKNKTVGLFFPSLRAHDGMNVVSCFASVFGAMGFKTPMGKITDPMFKVVNTFLSMPLEMRPLGYHTTLCAPHFPFGAGESALSWYYAQRAGQEAVFLPIKHDCCAEVLATLPYGVHWYNPKRKNHLFVSTITLATFSGITESFHVCPIRFDLRYQMHEMLLQAMCELHDRTSKPGDLNKEILRPVLPEFLQKFGDPLVNTCDEPLDKKRKIAWMELALFEDKDYSSAALGKEAIERDKNDRLERCKRLIDYVFTSGLDTLWISLSPNIYYSAIARNKQTKTKHHFDKEQAFLAGIKRFTSMLKTEGEKRGHALPALFVGFEIANNLYEPHLPQRCAVDVYGNTYPDLPAPLDRRFWLTEIKDPLLTFLEKWNWPEVGSGLQLAGVVLDLEMYCRKKSGTFLSTMGFDGYIFNRFSRSVQMLPVHDRVLHLMKHGLAREYYRFLEDEAYNLGHDMHNFFNRVIRNCQIMCYTPNILISWFYKGFFKGLSSVGSPLHLMTFNAEFKAHRPWFLRSGIHVCHDSVLLLSKIKTLNDVHHARDVLNHHHGIWLNRFSRFAEPKATDWTAVEQPALPESQYKDLCVKFNALE